MIEMTGNWFSAVVVKALTVPARIGCLLRFSLFKCFNTFHPIARN
jgi:hypothetical protein